MIHLKHEAYSVREHFLNLRVLSWRFRIQKIWIREAQLYARQCPVFLRLTLKQFQFQLLTLHVSLVTFRKDVMYSLRALTCYSQIRRREMSNLHHSVYLKYLACLQGPLLNRYIWTWFSSLGVKLDSNFISILIFAHPFHIRIRFLLPLKSINMED